MVMPIQSKSCITPSQTTLRARQHDLPCVAPTNRGRVVFPQYVLDCVLRYGGTDEFESKRYMTHTSVRRYGLSVPMALSLLRRDTKLLRNSVWRSFPTLQVVVKLVRCVTSPRG